jgi:CubicO group peptidase (beta-lactamase class C family)
MKQTRRMFLGSAAAGVAGASTAALWPQGATGAEMNHEDLQRALDSACLKHNVPGISAAFFADGRLVSASSGVTNVETGIAMTPAALMHVGSITKIFTATLVMQLVDEGKLALGKPVVEYMPDFRVADPEATRAITVGELLNHTSGIDANLLPDVGHDKETIVNTVSRIALAPQLHAPDAARSYCNAGMVVAGYLCQRIAGKSWYDLIKERIFAPLGMSAAVVLPEEAVLYRLSVGHYLVNGKVIRTPLAFLPIGYAPAGSTAMMTANDLMTFGRAHVANGVGNDGKSILSAASAVLMREEFGKVNGPQAFNCGIAWQLAEGLVFHGGGGPGIVSVLVTHPKSQTAAVVLTNADHGVGAIADLVKPFFKTRLGIDTFAPPPAPLADQNIDPSPYIGIYQNSSVVHEIQAGRNRLEWTAYARESYDAGSRANGLPTKLLQSAGDGRFVAGESVVRFLDPETSGRMRYLALDLWLYRRRTDGS